MDTTVTDGQLTEAIKTMRQKGMTPERFNKLLGSGIFADVCDVSACLDDRNAVRTALKLGVALPESITLSVDYSRSLEQMIAAGHYDWKNDDITAKRFPIKARYFNFDHNISSENAIKKIEAEDAANPWMPAKIEHVLSHGKTFPEEQRKFPIVALGSVARVSGYRYVPCLHRGGSRRGLSASLGGTVTGVRSVASSPFARSLCLRISGLRSL